jgi:hypothetical protein
MLTWGEKIRFMINKKKMPHLKILMGHNFSGTIKWSLIDAWKMGEYYWIPSISQKIPPPPRDSINDFKGCDGMVIILSPERNMFEFIKVHVGHRKSTDGKNIVDKIYWVKMPDVVTSEVLETVKKDSEFKLLYAQSLRAMEQEKMMFMSWINKNITLIVGIICVIALAIIIYVSVGGVTKVINVMAEALKVAPTCNVQQMQQIAKNVSIF